ncbi:TRAP transporter small permease subunit [Halomonas denitrificans]|uniref:TRAP transporter small permease n=1 Tax=Halomonas TaxID=2745 RepID=UPI001A901717|nr:MULTISPECIES: TRAP transporter small permease subunit [Halomonas]MBN8411596.1 TRAP transporter small permease subunit [Halomonas litopenaei]MED5295448.1 TRAP transporter small permease subunit [Pseudomonadota bacterium]MBY5923891.1 TRAP transporter small permease subunit [Halomonas sp. DP4Y7-2]MBY5928041.1 TRAP transporter small permease subunit [Halomonas sp. DP8Y7-3]MBY5982913.1 TRAP transporter small permease subunit [Halomonas sp. DP5Y7-2]
MLTTISAAYQKLLEVIVFLNVLALTLVVTIGFASRLLGSPFSWYDEVASIGLAWLTYYGAALAALKGAHIACPSVINMVSPSIRLPIALLAEAITIGFFVLLGVTGFQVVQILEGSTLVSLPSISVQFTQSVIPIGAAMFILAQLLRLPDVIRAAKGAGFVDHELEEAGVLADDVRSDDPPAMPEGQMPRRTP